jgi:hypothetical protein
MQGSKGVQKLKDLGVTAEIDPVELDSTDDQQITAVVLMVNPTEHSRSLSNIIHLVTIRLLLKITSLQPAILEMRSLMST